MKILVLATDYPRPDGYVSQYFIHSRNKEYIKCGVDVSVLSFNATSDYVIDDVKVYSYKSYQGNLFSERFDILASHAPNIRNHYKFLKKYEARFPKIVFFFHGGEVLKSSDIYPKPFNYTKRGTRMYSLFIDMYDNIKLALWKKAFAEYAFKSEFVFVSNWMYQMFMKFVKLNPMLIQNKSHIIYNCCGKEFQDKYYDFEKDKKYDFITIRNILDKSKYCIDVVNQMAKNNPEYSFCVIGRGEYFKFNEKANNLDYIEQHLDHSEIINVLNDSKAALMPTRADAQGVMACEMATFGIPLITSDISVCKEVLGDFENVIFINNNEKSKVESIKLITSNEKNKKFFLENTTYREIELFKTLVGEISK